MKHDWQHYRDLASRLDNIEVLRMLYSAITFDATALALSQLGATSGELICELEFSAESRRLARDLLATAWYIAQGEKLQVAKTWLIGLHPGFAEIAPIDLMRSGRGDVVFEHLRTDGRLFNFSLSA